MKFHRLAILYFEPPPRGWDSFEIKIGDVVARTVPIAKAPALKNRTRILLKAEIRLETMPTLDTEHYILVPELERRRCEEVIEHIANIIAVTCACRRSICSATPSAGFVAESEDERLFLGKSSGVLAQQRSISGASYQMEPTQELIGGLDDRKDGVALMAEALSHGQAIAKYRDLIRLFELAFASPLNKMEKKLAQYLSKSNLGYSRPEIKEWFSMRDAATHADLKKTQKIALEADIVPFIRRMEQAAMDVLFNKEDWKNRSRTRREHLKPLARSTSSNGDFVFVKDSKVSIEFQLLDEFGAYPVDLHGGTLTSPPQEWWWKPRETDPLDSARVEDATGEV